MPLTGSSPTQHDYFAVVSKIALAQRKAFDTDWILSKIMGDEIHHAHVWVFPSWNIKEDKNDFEGNRKKIAEGLMTSS